MSEELAALCQVQEVDTEMARLAAALAGLEDGQALQAEVAAVESGLAALRDRHRASEQESLAQNLELKTLEEKKVKFETQLYGGTVRNPKQLSDLQAEVAMLAREIGKVEDRILELMEALEQERTQIGQQEAQLAGRRERLAAVRQHYRATGDRLRSDLAELENQRKERAARVPPLLLKRYEQIRARQANLAIVKVTASSCPGCRITLPSETLKALKAEQGVRTCENCGRLLFWDNSAG